jgi:hypothetical protein
MFPGMSGSISISLASSSDPGTPSGSSLWWATGWCRPAYLWDSSDRPRKRLLRRLLLRRVR